MRKGNEPNQLNTETQKGRVSLASGTPSTKLKLSLCTMATFKFCPISAAVGYATRVFEDGALGQVAALDSGFGEFSIKLEDSTTATQAAIKTSYETAIEGYIEDDDSWDD